MSKSVYIVVQNQEGVKLQDHIVIACTTQHDAEKWILEHCKDYGDCISTITGQFIRPFSYEQYKNGRALYYMIENNPALKIIECSLIGVEPHIEFEYV